MRMSSLSSTPVASPSTTPLPIHPKSASMDLSFNVNTMEDDLTCPVCLELYADPLMLPCSHSICKKCLQDILASRRKQSQEGLECPSCRKQLAVGGDKISKLPRNLALENVVFRYQEIKVQTLTKSRSLDASFERPCSPVELTVDLPVFDEETSSQNCGLCDAKTANRAVWFCQQCAVLYCKPCLEKFHPKRGALARHKLSRPAPESREAKPATCADHAEEMVSIFCRVCQKLICPLCMCEGTGKHSGHQVIDQETALTQTKDHLTESKASLETMLTKLTNQNHRLEEVVEETESLHREAAQRIECQYRRYVDDLVSALRQHKEATLVRLGVVKYRVSKELRTHMDDNRRHIKHMDNLAATCKSLLQEDRQGALLERAAEAGPIRKQLTHLSQHVETSEKNCEEMLADHSLQKDLKSSLAQFRSATEATIQLFLQNECQGCPEIRPTFQSPTSPGKTEAPRIQNKCLMTWGFNSSTFTAEKLEQNAAWTVTIEKNSSHIGDMRTGYLFGVGIALNSLNIKDRVGMNRRSYGLACLDGQLVFVHDSKHETLMPLENLPLSLTMYVNTEPEDSIVMAYMVTSATWGDSLQGKKFLSKGVGKESLYPVFTVSQRVKIQFPTYV